ncbi:CBU_0592 family membrane protein [Joostella sp. CR20]|uniref:CBU_0592 family membrane protein n=1 Tax=Joostella sp. CR20 TaxID=2804312 RepID=UPI00313B97DB
MEIHNIIGWIGALLFIIAYFLLSIEKLSAKNKTYHLLNISGAVCLVINGLYLSDYPNVVVNLIWGIIAFYAVFKLIKSR